jgi:cell division septal protein FtsQ
MSGADIPEESKLSAEQAPSSAEETVTNEVESVFSQRSGIRDPLVKTAAPSEEVAPTEAPAVPSEAEPQKSPGKQKGTRPPDKLKSKRNLDRARRRQENYLHTRRKKKKMRVFYGRIRLIFKLCFAVLLAALLWEVIQGTFWTYDSPRFALQDQHLLQPAQVAPLLRAWVGKPIYQVDVGKIERQIRQRFAIVNHVTVRRSLFPTALTVQIMENLPWAEIYADEKQTRPYAMIAADSMISMTDYPYQAGLYPGRTLVRLIMPPKTTYKTSFIGQVHEIAWQGRQIKGLHLHSVDVRNPNLLVLNYDEVPVILGPLNAGADSRLARLIPLVPKIKELQSDIKAVDLRWEEQAPSTKSRMPALRSQSRNPLSRPLVACV